MSKWTNMRRTKPPNISTSTWRSLPPPSRTGAQICRLRTCQPAERTTPTRARRTTGGSRPLCRRTGCCGGASNTRSFSATNCASGSTISSSLPKSSSQWPGSRAAKVCGGLGSVGARHLGHPTLNHVQKPLRVRPILLLDTHTACQDHPQRHQTRVSQVFYCTEPKLRGGSRTNQKPTKKAGKQASKQANKQTNKQPTPTKQPTNAPTNQPTRQPTNTTANNQHRTSQTEFGCKSASSATFSLKKHAIRSCSFLKECCFDLFVPSKSRTPARIRRHWQATDPCFKKCAFSHMPALNQFRTSKPGRQGPLKTCHPKPTGNHVRFANTCKFCHQIASDPHF